MPAPEDSLPALGPSTRSAPLHWVATPPTGTSPKTDHYIVTGAPFHLKCFVHCANSPHMMKSFGMRYAFNLAEMLVVLPQPHAAAINLGPVWCSTNLWKSYTSMAEACRVYLKRSRPSRCLSHRCRALSPVALVVVMCYEQNHPLSTTLCHNNYQSSSHADYDMSSAMWMNERETHHGRSTSDHTTCQARPTAAPRPDLGSAKHGWPLLQNLSMTVAPKTPAVLPPSPAHRSARLHRQTRSSTPRRRHLSIFLRSLLLGSVIASSGLAPQCLILGSLAGFLPATMADRFALRNGYGTVEARYHLTAYDCSDPLQVQAYSSVPASHCSTRDTPVRKDRRTRFQHLQKEKKRYIPAYVCFLSRTDIRYNCGVYEHPELDPMHWSFSVPQRVTFEQCMTWLRTRTYQPTNLITTPRLCTGRISPDPSC